MGRQSAVPGAGYTRAADRQGDAAGHGLKSIAQVGLPDHVIETLMGAGVHDLQDWARLGRKRRQIFGITGRTIAILDRAVREKRA